MTGNALDALAATPPHFDAARLQRLLKDEYALTGESRSLVSERDQNIRVTTPEGDRYVLKIASAAEDPLVTEFQVEALLHLGRNPLDFGVPGVRRTVCGAATTMLEGHVVRVVEFVSGNLLADSPMSVSLAASFGRRLAQLGVALSDFDHPGSGQELLWDMQRAAELRDIVQHIDDAETQDIVCRSLDDFEAVAMPLFGSLRRQVIHNDANPANVLTDSAGNAVVGFIDFGDMLAAPLIVDVAIAASYLRSSTANVLTYIVPFISAYDAINPLTIEEKALLQTLIRTRLATTLAILFWRVADREADDPYRRQSIASEADALGFLKELTAEDADNFAHALIP